jgi:hypothetical protein
MKPNQIVSLFFAILLLPVFSCQNSETIDVFEYTILMQENETTDSLTYEAAKVVQYYYKAVTGKDISIAATLNPGEKAICIGDDFLQFGLQDSIKGLHEDGFVIEVKGGNVAIVGLNGKATLFGAYSFVEDYLGCMKLSSKEDFIPEKDHLALKDGYKKYEPAFDFRRTLFPGQHNIAYRDWYKLEDLDEWGSFVHTFNKLISPEDYFEEHPEYFSLIGGRRLQDAQLCLSNPEVIQVLIDNLGKEIAKKPEKKIWSVSQNDAINYCECDNCFALYEQYGNISGAYIMMANEIAEAYPDKHISTLAYQYTRSAPQNIKPLPNVNIMFCSIECNRSMPLVEDERSAEFVQEMKDWSKLTNNIFVWDYVVQFKNYLTPFPNFHVLQPNIQFFKESNVNMMFQQGSSGTWSDLAELKQYVIAKLLWNPDADVDALVKNFIEMYYGPAAKHIQDYYDLAHKELIAKSKEQFLDIYGFPLSYTKAHLRPELMIEYKSIMDKAEKAVKEDEVYLDRVLRARLPVDFAYIDIAMNGGFEELSMIEETGEGKAVKPEMSRLLNTFVSNSQKSDNIRVNERNFTAEAYKEYALNKLKRLVADNLIANADVEIKTAYSEIYPVGGEKAINDGLFGDLDYHNNWLGFEGHDMVLEIDMKEETTFSGIDMNFLKAVNSWVFLPVNIDVEVSDDGKTYRHLMNKKGDTQDQNYLVKSIPFEFRFDKETARYIRIKAESLKIFPDWHRGFGKPSWIFVDEVVVLK